MVTLKSNSSEWYKNDDMVILYEAMIKLSLESLYTKSKNSIPRGILKNYITQVDEYGDYFTKKEYQSFQNAMSPNYAGIGMLLYQQKRNEKILCIPIDGNLKKLGISQYDQLISIDGQSVQKKNFYLVSSLIRGKKNSNVKLTLQKPSGKINTVTLKRTEQTFKTVQRVIEDKIVMIRIIRFMRETPRELDTILRQWPKNIPIVIDLRGNGGGDLFTAIDCADMFLPKDSVISSIETRKKHIDYLASTPDSIDGRPIILLQDNFTASAAEVFISALTQNNRAKSIGGKSFGKGVAQKFILLSNGDALLLTYGKIITANKESYDKKGLTPTSKLSLNELIDKNYSGID